ncbi:MAG: PhoH-like family protein [Chlamydiales bacterium]|jgi:PhoH-like ATPase|nr:PhoH-like family protein [Chlamydiales bacterium]
MRISEIFVLDTTVLVYDPEALLKFPNSQVIIPMTVLEELDAIKKQPNEIGKNARQAIRLLDTIREQGQGDLHHGLKLQNGGMLKILTDSQPIVVKGLDSNPKNSKILIAAYLKVELKQRVIFVSKDIAARVKAHALGLEAEDYENLKHAFASLYRGFQIVQTEKKYIDLLYRDGKVHLPELKFNPNEYCYLQCPENSSLLARYDQASDALESVPQLHPAIWGIKALSTEQRCAIDLLLRDDIKLVTLLGAAGTGKTLMALACGLRKVFDEGFYNKILVSRPIVPLGKDIGFLPGAKEEKLLHWMQPIYDNLEFLCSSYGHDEGDARVHSETLRWVMDSKKIEMEAVTYIRGRSLPKMYIIVDEAQNLTPHEVKTIISRAGRETKVILTGDPTQIDSPYLDQDSNGLTYTIAKFQGQPIFGHIHLSKTERSELAGLAAQLL